MRVTERGKEACECVVKLTTAVTVAPPCQAQRRQPHSRQSCESTYRNLIQGRFEQASEPTITKPLSFIRIGKSGGSAAKVNPLILGELEPESGSRLDAESRNAFSLVNACFQQSAEVVVLIRHHPLATGRTEP